MALSTLVEIPVIDAPRQSLSTVLNGVPVDLHIAFNEFVGLWALAVATESIWRVTGRLMIPGVDLIKPFGLGIGKLALIDMIGDGSKPGRSEVPAGLFRLYGAW